MIIGDFIQGTTIYLSYVTYEKNKNPMSFISELLTDMTLAINRQSWINYGRYN